MSYFETEEEKLRRLERERCERDNDDSFLTSMVLGAATDSALVGGLLGGDILGGIVGDLLNGGDL